MSEWSLANTLTI